MKQLRILAILLAVIFVTSCNKEDETRGRGDALIVVMKSGANTVYGISLYAYSLSTFSSVSAVNAAEPGKTYNLHKNKSNFAYETPDNDFKTDIPAAGTYDFTADFENGVHQVFSNTLTADVLPVPTFDKCEYNPLYDRLEIDWQIIDKAASYAVNIREGSKIVFASNEISLADLINPKTQIPEGKYAVRPFGGGWEADFTPEAGKTYTVRLFAYRYEPKGGSYNIQCVSMADTSVVWGD